MSVPTAAALIRRKREAGRLSAVELQALAQGIASGAWSDGQIGAFSMAVAWRGMSIDECVDFTLALRDSGDCLHWEDLPGPVLDKHSTGGVGDCVSLLLAPLLAACGAYVPMISGRGLGHTGGTLDKLESIPGYQVNPEPTRLRAVIREVGAAIIGQSARLVPADRRLYAVRDVSATVDVPALMVASILSKKLAGGAGALVLDVKTGSGAQTPTESAARDLAEILLRVANGAGLATRAALTDMGQVLGNAAGNALEVRGVLAILRGAGCPRLTALSLQLAAELLCLCGLAHDHHGAHLQLQRALDSGAAAERFARMVAALGGPHDLLEKPDAYLARAPIQLAVTADRPGFVGAIDVRALGMAVVDLGGGRRHPDQRIDPAVGLAAVLGRGVAVAVGDPLAIVHAEDAASAEAAAAAVRMAIRIDPVAPDLVALCRWVQPQTEAV